MLDFKYKIYALLLLLLEVGFSLELPNSYIDIYIGQTYKDLKQKYQLKRISYDDDEFYKIYKIIHNEIYNIEILVYFFLSKVVKISVMYGRDFLDDNDWKNIFEQAIINYGQPKITSTEIGNSTLKQCYLWEDEKIKQTYICILENENLKSFYIKLTDKVTEQKLQNSSKIKKLYYKLLKHFF